MPPRVFLPSPSPPPTLSFHPHNSHTAPQHHSTNHLIALAHIQQNGRGFLLCVASSPTSSSSAYSMLYSICVCWPIVGRIQQQSIVSARASSRQTLGCMLYRLMLTRIFVFCIDMRASVWQAIKSFIFRHVQREEICL